MRISLKSKKSKNGKNRNEAYRQAEAKWKRNDLKGAFQFFLESANEGYVPAFGTVGYFYDDGVGVRPNKDLALKWYKRAVAYGNRSSANNIGVIWREKGDLPRALKWFNRAVELGDPDANLEIAKIHLSRSQSSKKARLYLQKVVRTKRATLGSREEATGLLRWHFDAKN
jgi:TPR repeat protein